MRVIWGEELAGGAAKLMFNEPGLLPIGGNDEGLLKGFKIKPGRLGKN